jgi:hypothetical protein
MYSVLKLLISVGFWRWCVSNEQIVLLDFIHCLVSQKIEELKIYTKYQYTHPQNSHKVQLLTTEPLTWVHTHINSYSQTTNCHLGFFPWLLVFQGVCGRACALVCMRYLCFLGFYKLWSVQWLGHLLPLVSDLLQGFMCVCTQVSGSVVSNWTLCEFCGRVYWYLVYIFNSSIFWDTRRWIKSKSTIRSLLKLLLCGS